MILQQLSYIGYGLVGAALLASVPAMTAFLFQKYVVRESGTDWYKLKEDFGGFWILGIILYAVIAGVDLIGYLVCRFLFHL